MATTSTRKGRRYVGPGPFERTLTRHLDDTDLLIAQHGALSAITGEADPYDPEVTVDLDEILS